MVNIFLEMTKKVGIFMIISQTLMHLGMAKKYEKYIRLVISFMVAAQIIFSFAAFFKIENSAVWEFLERDFQQEWKQEVREFDEQLRKIQENMYEKVKADTEDFQKNESGEIKIMIRP